MGRRLIWRVFHTGDERSGLEVLKQSLLGGPYVTGSPTIASVSHGTRSAAGADARPVIWHADTEAAYWALSKWNFGCSRSSYVHSVATRDADGLVEPDLGHTGREYSDAAQVRTYRARRVQVRARLQSSSTILLVTT